MALQSTFQVEDSLANITCQISYFFSTKVILFYFLLFLVPSFMLTKTYFVFEGFTTYWTWVTIITWNGLLGKTF